MFATEEKKRILVPDAFSPEHAISHVHDLMRDRGHDVIAAHLDKNQNEEVEQMDECIEESVDLVNSAAEVMNQSVGSNVFLKT
jgi:hypothetical protein